jgi:DNA-binding NtrC family response regulator
MCIIMSQKITLCRLLIVDDYAASRNAVANVFEHDGWQISFADTAAKCIKAINSHPYDIVLLDLTLPDCDDLSLLQTIRTQQPDAKVIIFSAKDSAATYKKAFDMGVYDYIEKGGKLDLAVLRHKILRCFDEKMTAKMLQVGNSHTTRGAHRAMPKSHKATKMSVVEMIGESEVIRQLKEDIEEIAPFDIAVHITGETGSGKELVAQAIHDNSRRKTGPLVTFNCAALNEGTIISELFGHKKGAYTGSEGEKIGLLEAANGGTLFIDEIGDMPLPIQCMLLRALETKKIIPMGGTKEVAIDIRLVTATHKNLRECVKKGEMRLDFFQRICQSKINVAPLRARKEDIPLLVDYFLEKICDEEAIEQKTIGYDALELLLDNAWEGNIRELRSVLHLSICKAKSTRIDKSVVEKTLLQLT